MSEILKEIRIFNTIGHLDGVPVRLASTAANLLGGGMATFPADTNDATIAVTLDLLNLVDVDKEAFLGIMFHELGHIKLKHIEKDVSGLCLSPKKECEADAYALQYVNKEDLLKGLKFSENIVALAISNGGFLRKVLTKLEMKIRLFQRFSYFKFVKQEKQTRPLFKFTDEVIAVLEQSNIKVPTFA